MWIEFKATFWPELIRSWEPTEMYSGNVLHLEPPFYRLIYSIAILLAIFSGKEIKSFAHPKLEKDLMGRICGEKFSFIIFIIWEMRWVLSFISKWANWSNSVWPMAAVDEEKMLFDDSQYIDRRNMGRQLGDLFICKYVTLLAIETSSCAHNRAKWF